MQGAPAELGGFRGRTNKLVDGCYSWWVGGCVGLAEALLGQHARAAGEEDEEKKAESGEDEHAWADVDGAPSRPLPLGTR